MPRSTYLIASLLDECHEENAKAGCTSATDEPLELIHKGKLNREVPECSHDGEQSSGPQQPSESFYRRTLSVPIAPNQLYNFTGNVPTQCLPCRPSLPAHLQDLSPYSLSCLSQMITTRSHLIQMQQAAMQWSPPTPAITTSHMLSATEDSTRQFRTTLHHRQHRFRVLPNESQSTVKKYRCDICDKTFSRSNTLVTHKRIHTGEKPFHCDHCGRAFRQPGNLTRHRLTHTTVKPYVCSICEKAFNRASNLHTHMRTHSQVISSTITATQPLRPFER